MTEVQRRIASLPPPMTPVALLPMVDPKINTVYGTWARRAEGLISDSSDFARFEIPFYPPPEYDLEVEFSRLEGLSDLVFFLTHEGKSLAWTITGSGPDVRSWASIRNAWDTGSNPTRVNAPGWLENGRVSLCRIEVRRTLLRVSLDGKVLLEHRTTFEEMELPEWLRLRDPSKLGIGTYRSPTLIRRIQLLEIGARGRKSA